eukprot:2527966-Pleurochrysis_carterae.AAC.1
MQNFERHGVYVEISEDQLPSWNNTTRRAHEVIVKNIQLRCTSTTAEQWSWQRSADPASDRDTLTVAI